MDDSAVKGSLVRHSKRKKTTPCSSAYYIKPSPTQIREYLLQAMVAGYFEMRNMNRGWELDLQLPAIRAFRRNLKPLADTMSSETRTESCYVHLRLGEDESKGHLEFMFGFLKLCQDAEVFLYWGVIPRPTTTTNSHSSQGAKPAPPRKSRTPFPENMSGFLFLLHFVFLLSSHGSLWLRPGLHSNYYETDEEPEELPASESCGEEGGSVAEARMMSSAEGEGELKSGEKAEGPLEGMDLYDYSEWYGKYGLDVPLSYSKKSLILSRMKVALHCQTRTQLDEAIYDKAEQFMFAILQMVETLCAVHENVAELHDMFRLLLQGGDLFHYIMIGKASLFSFYFPVGFLPLCMSLWGSLFMPPSLFHFWCVW